VEFKPLVFKGNQLTLTVVELILLIVTFQLCSYETEKLTNSVRR